MQEDVIVDDNLDSALETVSQICEMLQRRNQPDLGSILGEAIAMQDKERFRACAEQIYRYMSKSR